VADDGAADYWPRLAARDRMAATKGMSASTTDGFTVFIGPSPPSACGGRDVDHQMVLNNPSVWQFTHAEYGEKGRRSDLGPSTALRTRCRATPSR
jgi:hypothetical protein